MMKHGSSYRESYKHKLAKVGVTVWLITIVASIVAAIKITDILSVNISSIIPVATVMAAGIGFGSQGIFKDIIQGSLIIMEKQYGVGDTVNLNPDSGSNNIGEVESLTLRATVIRKLNGDQVIYSNRNIEQITNMSSHFSVAVVDIPVPPPPLVNLDEVISIMEEAGKELRKAEPFKELIQSDVVVMGVPELHTHHVVIRTKVITKPAEQWEVERGFRKIAIQMLADKGITQNDIKASITEGAV